MSYDINQMNSWGMPQIPTAGSTMPTGPGIDTAGAAGTGLGTMGTINAGLSGLETIGKLWGAWQQMKLAKKQFNYTKKVTDTNLANSIQSFNTALKDRGRSRAFTEGQSKEQAASYIAENRLPEYERG